MTPRNQICHDCYEKEGQPRLPRTLVKHRLWISPIIGALGADNGLHCVVVSLVGAIQSQYTRKSSSLAKDSKRSRKDKDQEDFEKTGELESRKSPSTCLSFCKNRHTPSPRGVIGVWALFFLSFPHPERPSSISQHERSELLCGRSPLCR